MKNLVSIAPRFLTPVHMPVQAYAQHCGLLRSPRNPSHIQMALALGAIWAADNDCFMHYNPTRIEGFIRRIDPTGCKFFNVPDVIIRKQNSFVGDARLTLQRWSEWMPKIKHYGFPVAFTLQNGMDRLKIPFDEMDALFIGSSDSYRRNTHAGYVRDVIKEAKRLGKWVHIGRVNSISGIRYWKSTGADSFDGSGYTIQPAKAAYHLPYHATQHTQLYLWNETQEQAA